MAAAILPELMRAAPKAVLESLSTMTKINIEQLQGDIRRRAPWPFRCRPELVAHFAGSACYSL